MLFKYEDYPMGISEECIAKANIKELSRIVEIYHIEFKEAVDFATKDITNTILDVVECPKDSKESKISEVQKELKKVENRYHDFSVLLVHALRSWDENSLDISAKCLQASIFLGSLLEGTLQLFLLSFSSDYAKSNWKKWMKEDSESQVEFQKIKDGISEKLKSLQSEGEITNNQRTKLYQVIKDELKTHENTRKINRIMLDELIRLFESQKILEPILTDEEEKIIHDETAGREIIKKMDAIKNGRNSIHIFSKSITGDETNVIENVRNYCFIMEDLLSRVRYLDDDNKEELFIENIFKACPDAIILKYS